MVVEFSLVCVPADLRQGGTVHVTLT